MARSWSELQAVFAAGLLDAGLPPPTGVVECGGSLPRAGFAVYRNNSLIALVDALQERFAVTRRFVGDEFFRAMARAYASEHRPDSPLLMHYGDDFPAFIDEFAPAKAVFYLSDIARLEIAWSEAYHAAEARPLSSQVLVRMRPELLAATRLTLHPSTRLLSSDYPIGDIWSAQQSDGIAPPVRWDGQDVLVVRSDARVHVHTLGAGGYEFVRALLERRSVQDSAEIALSCHTSFDTGASLVMLFDVGAVIAICADAPENTA